MKCPCCYSVGIGHIFMNITVKSTAPAYGGYSLGKIGSKVVFVEGMLPSETAEVEITDERKDFSFGRITKIIDPSPARCLPACPHFGICGGCHFQHVTPEYQVTLKNEILTDALRRIGKLEIEPAPPLSGHAWNYRHRVQFKVSTNGEVGFYRKGTRDIVTIRTCPILLPDLNALLDRIRNGVLSRGMQEIHITLGDTPVAFVKGPVDNRDIPALFQDAGFSGIMMSHDSPGEPCRTSFPLLKFSYSVSPLTFIQSHWELNCILVETVASIIKEAKARHIVDLYAGAGNFSIPAAMSADRVTAVEESPTAAADGARNLELNGIDNCRFLNISAEKYRWKDHADLIILDPPRAGLTGSLAEKIVKSRARQIIYISCNPSTLARDLKKLSPAYAVTSVRQINFFPQTFHIEAMAILELR